MENPRRLISLNKWLGDMGVTSTTGWRWRKRGILQVVNIYGRLYLSDEAIADFHRRATAGEFAVESRPGKRPCPEPA
jgi:predicted site-specific integrase-resolvase